MKKLLLSFIVISASLILSQNYSKYLYYPISPVNIKNIVLNDNFWLPKIRIVQDTTIKYAFDKCDKEGRIENFLIAGGKKEGAYKGKMPFDDTDLYKIIEGASYSLMNKYDPNLDAYLDSIIAIIKIGQEEDGYITTWFTINREKPPAWWVKPSKTRWENEISSHELYNSGHLFEAAAAHYWATGKRNFLDIAIKNANLLVENFGPNKLHTPPGHQIVETGLIKLYQITHENKYLKLAKFFLDIRGDSTTHNLYGEYSQDHLPVTKQTEAVGHAVRALYMYAGMTDIAAIYKDTDYLNAVTKIWENIVYKKMYITGGLGSRHEGESFGNNYELPNLTAYNETCAAIASVYWNHRLFLLNGDSKFYDVIERTLYNGLIAGISLDGKNFFYPNPLESDGKFEFNMGSCTRQPWFDCSCCPTNLIRFIPSMPELIYAINDDSIYINLFISSSMQVSINNKKISLVQQTNYPWNGKVGIVINPDEEQTFTLKIRLPGWVLNKPLPGDLYSYVNSYSNNSKIMINGKEETIKLNKGYIEISKKWKKGDKIELDLPMTVHKVIANEKVKEDSNKIAIEYGPIVYCAEEIDNKNIDEIYIPSDIIFYTDEMNIAGEKFISLKGMIDGSEIKLIPYYLWSNRGIGKMKVWFDRK